MRTFGKILKMFFRSKGTQTIKKVWRSFTIEEWVKRKEIFYYEKKKILYRQTIKIK